MEASGRDNRGGGTAKATVTGTLQPAADGPGTLVTVVTDLAITGRPAQFGRGMIADVSGRLIGQFANCLASKLAEMPAPAAPAPPPAEAEAEAATSDAAAAEAATAETVAVTAETVAVTGEAVAVTGEAGGAGAAATAGAGAGAAATAGAGAGAAATNGAGAGQAGGATDGAATARVAAADPPPAPEPAPSTPAAPPPPASPPTPAEPIDLLQVTGVSAAVKRALPYVIGFVVAGLLTWALLSWLA